MEGEMTERSGCREGVVRFNSAELRVEETVKGRILDVGGVASEFEWDTGCSLRESLGRVILTRQFVNR